MMRLAKSVTRFSLLLVAGLLVLALPLQAQDFAWARGIGGTTEDIASDVTTDAAGNVYVTGYFTGTADFDPGAGVASLSAVGGLDVFVLKLDGAGRLEWARRMGGADDEAADSIIVDGDGSVYITGWFEGTVDFDPGVGMANLTASGESNAFICKLDSGGKFLWAKVLSASSNSEATGVWVDSAGIVYATGWFEGVADFDPGIGVANMTSAGGYDIFVSKLGRDGSFLWARQMGGPDHDYPLGISLDASSSIHTAGVFQGTADFDPGPGYLSLTATGEDDVFVSKLDEAGNFVWARCMGGTSRDIAWSVATDSSGNVYTTGWFEGTADFNPGIGVANLTSLGESSSFISKLDNSGSFVWARLLTGSGDSAGEGVEVDAAGNVYTAGYLAGEIDLDPGPGVFTLASAGQEDIYVSKLDSAGNFVWARRMGGPGYDWANGGISLSSGGSVHTAGAFASTVDFDPGDGIFTLTSAGDYDIFVVKLAGEPGGLPPVISSGGIVVANLLPAVNTVSFLSIISVFGENFSTETVLYPNLTNSGEIATTLGGACLMMNGESLPLFAVTPGQINAQVSANKTLGPASFSVVANCGTTAALTSPSVSLTPPPQNLTSGVEMATVEEATPAFFIFNPVASDGFIAARFNATESQPAVAVAPAGLFNDEYGPSRPAMPGDIILLYGTGWGETTAGLRAGQLASGAAELLPEASPKITLGGIQLAAEDVLYVGVTPGTAGLYQAAIRIPANAQPGNQQVVLTVYGKSTPVGPVIPIALP